MPRQKIDKKTVKKSCKTKGRKVKKTTNKLQKKKKKKKWGNKKEKLYL